ncbi:hypothetical protein D3C79_787490 [compost metagenome]
MGGLGQAGLAFKPHPAITAAQAHGEVCLMAQFGLQGRQTQGEAGWIVDAVEHLPQQRQATFEQLLIQLDEVAFAGAAEQNPRGQ